MTSGNATDDKKAPLQYQRPRWLFEEPDEAIERQAPEDGPLGFLIGGMANLTLLALSHQYLSAAEHLVTAIRSGRALDCDLANPVLFLYRQAIELTIKAALVKYPKTHDLDKLMSLLRKRVLTFAGVSVPDWVEQRIGELAAIDPGRSGTAFRYSEVGGRPVDGEFHVNLAHLCQEMSRLHAALVNLSQVLTESDEARVQESRSPAQEAS